MRASKVERWCQKHNWTELRRLDTGIWVAFPPGGVMETPLPSQIQKPKVKVIEFIVDTILLILVTVTMFAIAVVMSPFFIKPLIARRQNSSKKLSR